MPTMGEEMDEAAAARGEIAPYPDLDDLARKPTVADLMAPFLSEEARRIALEQEQAIRTELMTNPIAAAAYQLGRMEGSDVYGPEAIERHLRSVLIHLGLDVKNQHFGNTPARWAKALRQYVQKIDLEALLSDGFEDDDPGETKNEKTLVVQTAIPFMGICAHHVLPFFGAAAVGYLPRDRVVGLSKLTRLVYAAGHLAPTTQEHITNLVADTLYNSKIIQPRGVAVLASALHGCMAVRGVESPLTRTITSAIRGDAFIDNPSLETKFMTLAMEGLQ